MQHISSVIAHMAARKNPCDGDFYKGDILYCGKCKTPKEMRFPIPTEVLGVTLEVVPVMCDCAKAAQEAWEARQRREKADSMRKVCIPSRKLHGCTFDADDHANSRISQFCRRYAEHWKEMFADNQGILLYGDVGTGKSFFAAAIANALVDNLIPVRMMSASQIASESLYHTDGRETFERLAVRIPLLIIDDLFCERDEKTNLERVFRIIDARYRAQMPLIVTTNMPLEAIKSASDVNMRRVCDRLLEMCPTRIPVTGASRRSDIAKAKREDLFARFGGET